MNYLLQKLIFTLTFAISLTLIASVSYAKDELDTTSKTSTTNDSKAKESEAKESKAKESKEQKPSDTKSKDSKVNSADKSTKDSKETDSTPSKKSNDAKRSGAKADSKTDKTSSKTSQQSTTTTSSSSKKTTTTTSTTTKNSTAKKQYKNVVVNLNKANGETFSHYLMGIGKVKAEAIVAYRKQNGKFKTIDNLLKVDGIGEKVFAGLKKNISLTTGKTSVSEADKSAKTKAK
jgi:comEA protein